MLQLWQNIRLPRRIQRGRGRGPGGAEVLPQAAQCELEQAVLAVKACESRIGRVSGPFPPVVDDGLSLSALTAAIA